MNNSQPTIPHSREAEEATLGSILINPDAYYECAQYIQAPDDFYIHKNRFVWSAIHFLAEERKAVDFLTLSEQLESMGHLEEIGGQAYLMSLINQSPTSFNAANYAHIVADHAHRRRLINAANRIAQVAYNTELGAEEAQAEAGSAVLEADRGSFNKGEMLSSAVSRVYDKVDENTARARRGEKLDIGLKLGLDDIDKLLMGVKRGKLMLVAARPGMGKSSLMLQVAQHDADERGKLNAFFSIEMDNEELAERAVSGVAKIDSQKLRVGVLDDDDFPSFTHGIEVTSNRSVYLCYTPSLTPAQLRAQCMSLAGRYELGAVFVDYIQLMWGGMQFGNKNLEVSYISRNLKTLAGELGVPVVVGCQLSRAGVARSEKRPILSDLRDSGSLEQDADIVLFLHRDEYGGVNAATESIVAKHRGGPTGVEKLTFNQPLTRFESWKGDNNGRQMWQNGI
jgi:replicative DNA helicase